MAWIRTSVSMISFGFTIYKFFDYLIEVDKAVPPPSRLGPRRFALGMIALGVITLFAATVQHRRILKLLTPDSPPRYGSLAGKVAITVSILGVLLLASVMLRM